MSQWVRNRINDLVRQYLHYHYRHISYFKTHPIQAQQQWWNKIIKKGAFTTWGKQHGLHKISNYTEFNRQIPINTYEDLKPYITNMMGGMPNVLWPGKITWYSKSAGTTDKSKYIPVSDENLQTCHIRSSWDAVAIIYSHQPDLTLFADKTLLMGGSLSRLPEFPQAMVGDISAIMIHRMPFIGKPFFTPDERTALLTDWEEKIEAMVRILLNEPDLVMLGGVPTWTVVLIKKLLEQSGHDNLLNLFPKLSAYMHGGTGFEPYREQFQNYIPKPGFIYQEIYNASEGYFAIQDIYNRQEMLLLLDHGIFYEFMPLEEWGTSAPRCIPLQEVELDQVYVMVMTNNSGLWRYVPGDTIRFVSTHPYRIRITGRIKQFINVFGEELMVHNAEEAMGRVCRTMHLKVNDYTVGPIFLNDRHKGAHQWVIEFETPPQNLEAFGQLLDQTIQELNSDYQAKRFKNMALENLKVNVVPSGTFLKWMRAKGSLGGQNKVPRLANDRRYVEAILGMLNNQMS